MMNNMDNNIAEEQKETKSLAEIMESFGKAFLKLWWIAVILLLGVSIVAVVGGLVIKHKTDDSIRHK